MSSITGFNILNINLGPSITGVGSIGRGAPPPSPEALSPLPISWHHLTDNASTFSFLSWHTRVSDFRGRDTEVQNLQDWAAGEPAVSVKFITGAGGVGKSRLAGEFAQKLNDEGWSAGFVNLSEPKVFPLHIEGTLLIIDYPEEQREGVTALLSGLAKQGTEHHIRVLFLTRQRLDAWQELIHDCKAVDIVDTLPLDLGGLEGPAAHALYNSALEQVAEKMDTVPPPLSEEALSAWLEQAPLNDRALFILAAAVHNAIYPDDPAVRYTGTQVMNDLVTREVDRLRALAKSIGATHPLALAKTVSLATISDGLSLDRVVSLAERDDIDLGFDNNADVAEDVRTAGIASAGVVPAAKPDIVAAAFVVVVLSEDPESAAESIWAAMEEDLEGGLQRIARLSYDAEVDLGLRENRLSKWLAEALQGRADRCEASDDFLSRGDVSWGLRDAAVSLGRTLLDVCESDEEKSRLLTNLSVNLYRVGDRAGALDAIKEAVGIHRKLAQADPAVYEPYLAVSLNNLSTCLNATGDRAGALEAIKEAVGIYRKLAQADPAVYEPDLAMSLNNLANRLDATGDRAGALEAIKEAVGIYRKLAQADPAVYEPNLAMSLNNLSNRLNATGDRAGALEAIKEAVGIYRKLAQADPAVHEPNLAMSLNNLANRLNATGDRAGALEAIKEALGIYRKLAQADPAVHEPNLAMSLNNLANRLGATGDRAGALEAIKEAVEIRRKLAQADPAVYEPGLAMSLNNLANRLGATGDRAGALDAIKEAVEIYRKLAQADPAVYEPYLAGSLNNLSTCLDATGDRAGGLEAIKEAVEIRRKLAQADPAVYEPDLAVSLNNLSNRLGATGDRAGALEAIKEAVEIRRKLAQADPAVYEPGLAMSLNNLANRLGATGDRAGALDAIKEAVEIYRKLAQADPAVYEPYLAGSLGLLGTILVQEGAVKEATKALKESIQLIRPYAKKWLHGRDAELLEAAKAKLADLA